jgi:hypothetical protein
VQLVFVLLQHSRDTEVMQEFVNFFSCGHYNERSNGLAGDYTVSRIKDIKDKIIMFFDQYPLQGAKALDFEDFKKAVQLVHNKDHLTKEGFDRIQIIKSGMNSLRNY